MKNSESSASVLCVGRVCSGACCVCGVECAAEDVSASCESVSKRREFDVQASPFYFPRSEIRTLRLHPASVGVCLDGFPKLMFLSYLLLAGAAQLTFAWDDLLTPIVQYHNYGEVKGWQFEGNTTATDHIKLLSQDGLHLLIGARNVVYNITLPDLKIVGKIEWYSTEEDILTCLRKGKTEEECLNYVRILVKKKGKEGNNVLLVCGTNAFKPLCREYQQRADGTYEDGPPFDGKGLCPFNPRHNSTACYIDDQLYVATEVDFSSTESMIYREPLRTEQYDLVHLNAPDFVSSFAYGDFVFFFFREMAVEYTNCGKSVYSRVARVCRNDRGGPHSFSHRWTSFLKARLNCSLPGEFPFYFDEIQSTSEIVRGVYGEKEEEIIYGVFTTPQNSLPGSAICAFNMRSLMDTFSGPFKEQATPQSLWLQVRSKVPEPHPGQCVNDSKTLSDDSLNFIKQHPLMDEAVPHFFRQPILVRATFKYRFTKIAVDAAVRSADGRLVDVLFIGTDDGHILKVINAHAFDSVDGVQPVVVEEIQVLPPGSAVTNLLLVGARKRNGESSADGVEPGMVIPRNLIVVSDDQILSISVERCAANAGSSCSACVALRDPYCGWNIRTQKCESLPEPHHIQNIETGESLRCPDHGSFFRSPDNKLSPVFPPPNPSNGDTENTNNIIRGGTTTNNNQSPVGMGGSVNVGLSKTVYSDMEDPVSPSSSSSGAGNGISNGINNNGPSSFPTIEHAGSVYTAETFAIAVTTSCVFALMVGFIGGYIFSRRCKPEDFASSYAGFRFPGDFHTSSDGGFLNSSTNAPMNNKSINLVINVPSKTTNGKTPNSAVDTKPMQTVKKIYL